MMSPHVFSVNSDRDQHTQPRLRNSYRIAAKKAVVHGRTRRTGRHGQECEWIVCNIRLCFGVQRRNGAKDMGQANFTT